jgi:hypothetical protein
MPTVTHTPCAAPPEAALPGGEQMVSQFDSLRFEADAP